MAQYELNLQDYWRIIRKRRWVVILIFFTVFASTWVYTTLQPEVYQVRTTAKYEEEKTMGDLWREFFTYTPGDPMLTQAKVARSSDVIEIAAIQLGLITSQANREDKAGVIASLQFYIATDVEKDTNIVIVDVMHSNPKEAVQIANAVAEAYVAYNLQEKSRKANNLIKTLEERLGNEKVKLTQSEEDLKTFKETNPQIMNLANSLNVRLERLKSERDKLLRNYTSRHPEVINLSQQIKDITKQLQSVQGEITTLSQLTREVEIHDSLYRELKQKYESALISKAEKVSDVSVVDRPVEPTKPIKPNKPLSRMAGFIIGLMLGLVSAFVVEHLDTSIGTIEEIESLLQIPVLGVIPHLPSIAHEQGGLLNKILPRGKKDQRISQSDEIRSQLVFNYSSNSPITESYRILRTNVASQAKKAPEVARVSGIRIDQAGGQALSSSADMIVSGSHVILVTSTGPGEGKTITAANLAITMAQKGERVLLVDADMRKAIVYKIFGLDREPGLSDLLMGTRKLDDTIRTITDTLMGGLDWDVVLSTPGIDHLHILTSGSEVVNPAELLGSRATASLLKELKNRYDHIIFDCPPILPVTDVLILGPHSDSVVMIYRAGWTAKGVLLRAKDQLTNANIHVKGIVLNHTTPEIEVSSNYYYHYYQYESGEKK
ncbi:MAG: polysaccharide biosynthesis tyrosine autokinase [Planctomycetes bacterium]|nr:polysaccharide biosynthesis tyrosine autokinase [Planctomycetota bacterium]